MKQVAVNVTDRVINVNGGKGRCFGHEAIRLAQGGRWCADNGAERIAAQPTPVQR